MERETYQDRQSYYARTVVLRDSHGIRWSLPNYSEEENCQLAIRNIQGLFLEQFPEFDTLYLEREGLRVIEEKASEAKKFILETVGTRQKFLCVFGSSPLNRRFVPYFNGSYPVVIRESFSPLGIDFEELTKSKRIRTLLINESSPATVREQSYDEGIKLFLDYLRDESSVDTSQLKEFTAKIAKNNIVRIGSVDRKSVLVFIPKSESFEPDQEIICKPQYDKSLGHTWLEGYVEDGIEGQIFSRRFYRGDRNLYQWRGPETQSLSDWIRGLVSFDRTRPAIVTLQDKSKHITIEGGDHMNRIILQLHQTSGLSQFDRVKLVPKKDEFYEWLEVYKIHEDGSSTRLLTYRIDREKQNKLDGSWPGPERQRLKEFLEGELPPDKLVPFTLSVRSDGRFYPLVHNRKSVELHLSPTRMFQPSKKITIVPSVNAEGDLILSISTDESYMYHSRFIFDKQASRFIKLSASQESSISPEEANEQLRKLLEE